MWTKLECYRPRHCCQVDNNEKWQCSCVANSSPIQPPIRVHILPTVLSTSRGSPWFWWLKIEITNILQWCFTQTNPIWWRKWWVSKLPTCRFWIVPPALSIWYLAKPAPHSVSCALAPGIIHPPHNWWARWGGWLQVRVACNYDVRKLFSLI